MADVELLSKRLCVLEARFRRLRTLALAGCVVVAALGIMGQAPGVPAEVLPSGRLRIETQAFRDPPVETEVRSQRFVLVDESGRERASLAADRAGSVFFVMFDDAGKSRASLAVSPQGPSLVFMDPSGQVRTVLGSTSLVGSRISENGIVERSPSSSIVLFDRNGKLLYRAP